MWTLALWTLVGRATIGAAHPDASQEPQSRIQETGVMDALCTLVGRATVRSLDRNDLGRKTSRVRVRPYRRHRSYVFPGYRCSDRCRLASGRAIGRCRAEAAVRVEVRREAWKWAYCVEMPLSRAAVSGRRAFVTGGLRLCVWAEERPVPVRGASCASASESESRIV